MTPENLVLVARLGRSVGLLGALKCQIFTDFPEIFSQGRTFFAKNNENSGSTRQITLKNFDFSKNIANFCEIPDIDTAKIFTNNLLFSTRKDTENFCTLKENEFFWHDIFGCIVIENAEILGTVIDISRIAGTDFLHVAPDPKNTKKFFLIPHIPRYVLRTDTRLRQIFTRDAIFLRT